MTQLKRETDEQEGRKGSREEAQRMGGGLQIYRNREGGRRRKGGRQTYRKKDPEAEREDR